MAGKIAELNTPRPHSVFPRVLSICQTRISKLLQFRSLVLASTSHNWHQICKAK